MRDFNSNFSAKRTRARANRGAQPLEKRLKSLDEFERPSWFPRFRLPTSKQAAPFPWAFLIVGAVLGAGLGWYVVG